MVGYDNIDLSMELLADRREAVQQIAAYLQSPPEIISSAPVTVRGKGKGKDVGTSGVEVLNSEDARRRMEETLRANAARPLFTGTAVRTASQVM